MTVTANSGGAALVARRHRLLYRTLGLGLGLGLALLSLGGLALCLGEPMLSPAQVWDILVRGGGEALPRLIVGEIRLPRLLLGALAGAGLALAGVLLQDSLGNAMAGPELLGISSGAAVVITAIVILRLPVGPEWQAWLALGGGLLAGTLILSLARRVPGPTSLILVGAAISALLGAALIGIVSLGRPQDIQQIFSFLLGSLAGRNWQSFWLALPWLLAGIIAALLCARPLNLLQLGDELAEGLGLKVVRARVLIGLISAVLTAAVVANCGPIGFVALLSPHLARRLAGSSDARFVLPLAAVFGAVLLIGADLLARQALFPVELPVGSFTTLLAGPLLLWLLGRPLKAEKQ